MISFSSFVKHFSSFIKQICQMSGIGFPNNFNTSVIQIHEPHFQFRSVEKNIHFVKSI